MKNKKIEKTILMFLACAITAYIIPVTNVFAKNQIPTILGVSGNNELTEDINANISLGQSENSLNDSRSNNTLSLNYEDIYNSAEERYKTFAELSIEHAELSTANTLILNFDTDDLVIFTGIDGIENSQIEIVDINITAINAYSNHFALGENVIVNRITVGDENGANVGSVVVLGKANELIVRENSRVLASYSLRLVDDGSTYEWYGDDTSNATQRPEEVSGVAIGAYNGGEISSLVIEDNVTIQTGGLGFLGAVVGAYENSKIGKITIGNYVQIATSYVQMVIGSNSGSTVGDINIGSNINIYCSNAMYAHIGAASGPDEIRKPSSVGIINMRQSTNIYSDQWGANPDHVSNVCIGSERGSYVERIRIAEEWDDIKVIGEPWSAEDVNANNRYSSLWLYTSTNVSIGTYDGIVGSGNGDAIFIGNASIFDNSYAPGALIIGATNNGVINGDIDLSTAALGTQFTGLDSANGDPTVKDSFATAIGSSFGGKVNGVIKLDSFLYASQYNTPPTIIGPNGEGSYVKEVQINDLLTVRTESYEVSRDTVIGSETGQLDKITINGDLYIQMPQKISAEMGHDFIADSIIIKSGNIIGFDAQNKQDNVSWYFDGNSKTEVPPWYHDHFRMSVKPKKYIWRQFKILSNNQ